MKVAFTTQDQRPISYTTFVVKYLCNFWKSSYIIRHITIQDPRTKIFRGSEKDWGESARCFAV